LAAGQRTDKTFICQNHYFLDTDFSLESDKSHFFMIRWVLSAVGIRRKVKQKDLIRELATEIGFGVIQAAQNDRRLRRALMSSSMGENIANKLNLIDQLKQ
jgi:hypothetical protein